MVIYTNMSTSITCTAPVYGPAYTTGKRSRAERDAAKHTPVANAAPPAWHEQPAAELQLPLPDFAVDYLDLVPKQADVESPGKYVELMHHEMMQSMYTSLLFEEAQPPPALPRRIVRAKRTLLSQRGKPDLAIVVPRLPVVKRMVPPPPPVSATRVSPLAIDGRWDGFDGELQKRPCRSGDMDISPMSPLNLRHLGIYD